MEKITRYGKDAVVYSLYSYKDTQPLIADFFNVLPKNKDLFTALKTLYSLNWKMCEAAIQELYAQLFGICGRNEVTAVGLLLYIIGGSAEVRDESIYYHPKFDETKTIEL